ncbi:MAG: hypothetical protein LCH26_08110 [Proteobacteria bacterium]|nr:hypothetical protein [Pseudomonadota bacterium]
MNKTILAALCFFATSVALASDASPQDGCGCSSSETDEISRQKSRILARTDRFTFEEFRDLFKDRLASSLHKMFEDGFAPLFKQAAERTPHASENKMIACFYEAVSRTDDLDVQAIHLATRLTAKGHGPFLPQEVTAWAKEILGSDD